jgi:hypothetical protein
MLTAELPFNIDNPIELFDVIKNQEWVQFDAPRTKADLNCPKIGRPSCKI